MTGRTDAQIGAAFLALPSAAAVFRESDGVAELVVANERLRVILGDSAERLLDSTVTLAQDIWPTVLLTIDAQQALLHVIAATPPRRVRLRARRSGDIVVVEFRTQADADTRELELRSRMNQLQDLVDNSTALMYVKDLDGRYLIANDYFLTLFAGTHETIIGRTDHEIFPASSADVYRTHDRQVLESGESLEVEEPFATIGGTTDPDDDRRWLSIKFPLIDEAGRPYALGAISTDITDRKRAESAARQGMHEAERANQSKNEFLSRMSHELRTPLNAILGFGQLLRGADLPVGDREAVAHILDAGQHLLALVNDVLDISWIEAGAPGLGNERFAAVEPIHQALEIIRPLAQAQDLELVSDLHGAMHRYVVGEPRRLRQVFINILGNAVKFNRQQGAIRVRCEESDGRLRYLVTDTGDGISEDDLSRLFSPFVRLSGAADTEGSGLGLALSKRLVEEMRGSIGIAHTAPGEGSTFFIEIPLAEDQSIDSSLAELATVVDDTEARHEATILHVEDTYANIRLVETIVAGMSGIDLVSATSGAEGIREARARIPDLVLLDLNLTDMSGLEVVRELRSDTSTSHIPIIVLSADATPARVAAARRAGVNEYLTKPFDVQHFARSVRAALES